MKQEYNIKDTVWIHLGEPTLVKGRVVEIITLDHLNESYPQGKEFYVIEIETGIDNVYEVREWESISSDAKGPINCFRFLGTETRALKKLGIKTTPALRKDTLDLEPTADEITAALERSEQSTRHPAMTVPSTPRPTKRRTFKKKNNT